MMRSVRFAALAVMVFVSALLAVPRATAAPAGPLPGGVPVPPPWVTQLVTVQVAGPASTTGTLSGWQRSGAGWERAIGPVAVSVGTAGVGQASEGISRTPAGVFPLPAAFGRQPNPGTKLSYRQVGDSDWWVGDSRSPMYNTAAFCAPGTCPFDERASENLGKVGPSYDYALIIGYNTGPRIPGAGSAFFVHVSAGIPSEGCVEVPRAQMISLLRWLDPAAQPQISIGYGG